MLTLPLCDLPHGLLGKFQQLTISFLLARRLVDQVSHERNL